MSVCCFVVFTEKRVTLRRNSIIQRNDDNGVKFKYGSRKTIKTHIEQYDNLSELMQK